jgi:quinol monooxygenase YgiN
METTRALLVHLDAKPGMESAVESFLQSALPLVVQEPATFAWFGVRFGRGEYGIFDAFPDEVSRNAHLTGPVAAALMAKSDELFSQAPRIRKFDVLADKRPITGVLASDTKGLLLTFAARNGHEQQVEQFLRDAQKFVMDEPKTAAWFALRLDNGEYGIFDVFPDNGGRFAHLTGHVPRELAKHALSLLGSVPDISMLEILAENFNTPP